MQYLGKNLRGGRRQRRRRTGTVPRNFGHTRFQLKNTRTDTSHIFRHSKDAIPGEEPTRRPSSTPKTHWHCTSKLWRWKLSIEKPPDGYLAYFPALEGCNTWGRTYEEAVVNAEDALALYLETL